MKKCVLIIALLFLVVQFFAAEKYAVLITGQAADHGDPTGSWALANPGRTRHTEFWYDKEAPVGGGCSPTQTRSRLAEWITSHRNRKLRLL